MRRRIDLNVHGAPECDTYGGAIWSGGWLIGQANLFPSVGPILNEGCRGRAAMIAGFRE
jgi:hypothetical protein